MVVTNRDDNLLKMAFLKDLTLAVIEESRIRPDESLLDKPGGQRLKGFTMPLRNQTGIDLILPGGGGCYPSFWIRDFALTLESGLIHPQELKQMMLLTASCQNGPEEILHDNACVPAFSVPDHINLDGKPVFFPGTYSPGKDSGGAEWGYYPPNCDHYYWIEMVYVYLLQTNDWSILSQHINGYSLIDRIWKAYLVPISDPSNEILYTDKHKRAVNFGFYDSITQTGHLLFSTILKYRAAKMLEHIYKNSSHLANSALLHKHISDIEQFVPLVFGDGSGWLKASTGLSAEHDIWSTCYAIYTGLLSGKSKMAALEVIRDGYSSGRTCFRGNVRHVPTNEDATLHSAWEVSASPAKNIYQNGAYWGTPAGWYAYALNGISPDLCTSLFNEYIDELVEGDFRKTGQIGSPWECFHPENEYKQNGIYLTSVSVPYSVFKRIFS